MTKAKKALRIILAVLAACIITALTITGVAYLIEMVSGVDQLWVFLIATQSVGFVYLIYQLAEARESRRKLDSSAIHEAGHAVAINKLAAGTIDTVSVKCEGDSVGNVIWEYYDSGQPYSLSTLTRLGIQICMAGGIAVGLGGRRLHNPNHNFGDNKMAREHALLMLGHISTEAELCEFILSPNELEAAIEAFVRPIREETYTLMSSEIQGVEALAAGLKRHKRMDGETVASILQQAH